MKLKLVYERQQGAVADLVVTVDPGATVAEVATAIATSDPQRAGQTLAGEVTLSVADPIGTKSVVLEPHRAIGEAPIASGFRVRLVSPDSTPVQTAGAGNAVLTVHSGPDAGRRFELLPGSHEVGRDPSSSIALSDPMVSKHHARLEISSVVELVDLNSANGILIDGGLVQRVTLEPDQRATLGDSVISVRSSGLQSAVSQRRVQVGSIPFNRSPRVEVRYPGRVYPRPEVPKELEKQPFPWLLMIAPLLLGGSMYLLTKNPMSLLFVALTPLMLSANYLMSRQRQQRQADNAADKFERQLELLSEELARQVPIEREVRTREAPGLESLLTSGIVRDHSLFTRRPEHWNFLSLRLGMGTALSRNSVAPPPEQDQGIPEFSDRLAELEDNYRSIDGVPIVENPLVSGALGVVGANAESAAVMRALMVQLTAMHSPAELVVLGMAGPQTAAEFEWLKWLPHVNSVHSPLTATPLADSAATINALLSQVEEVVTQRLGKDADSLVMKGPLPASPTAMAKGAQVGTEESVQQDPPALPIIVLLVGADAAVDRARIVQLTEKAPLAGIVPLWLAGDVAGLPASCRTFLTVADGLRNAQVSYVRHGLVVADVLPEGISRSEALKFGQSLSALVDSGAVITDDSDLPRTVNLLSLIGHGMATSPDTVIDRWRQNESVHDRRSGVVQRSRRKPSLRALVGQAGLDAMHLDLRAHGPHALVGGTPGSGKSEFLQAWVLGMASEYSPDRLAFLFVDYKGGAAFADCIKLPHCVGLVTDLSQHLVRRALTSLRAEIRYREHLLNSKKAKDLLELERRGDHDCPPALVLVIDEFAALVNDIPDFLDGVVDIAQRGRSLGIHVVMATQRPAGVIRDNLRANTNLRIALRMADETDSTDVIGSTDAAMFDPAIPGRAVAKTGPGRLVAFQSAYAGGWSEEQVAHELEVHEFRFGAEVRWNVPTVDESPERDLGPTDQSRLVESIRQAAVAAEVPAPRRPWLDELPRQLDLVPLTSKTDNAILIGLSDQPDQQVQQSIYFHPDKDGNLAVFGTGGSGKTVLLRTLAAGAGITPHGGPVHVYALDFASGGLRMLSSLPHVGAVISGDDVERVVRLFRMLKTTLEARAKVYPTFNAGSIDDYRERSGKTDEPRILLVVDGYPAFRTEFETGPGRAPTYAAFQQILSEGRALGMHVVFTADRPGAVSGAVASSVPRRVVLRLAEETLYTLLDVETDVLSASSPPGRAIIDGLEVQVAVLGGEVNLSDQAEAVNELAAAMRSVGVESAPPVGALPESVQLSVVAPKTGQLVFGIRDEDLGPAALEPTGTLLVGGPPGSGRSSALATLAEGALGALPKIELCYLGNRRSSLGQRAWFQSSATEVENVADLAKQLAAELPERSDRVAIFVEGLSEFAGTSAEAALIELFRVGKRTDALLVVESETSTWNSSAPMYAEIKAGRRGILLQPEALEGDLILRTSFPRVSRAEFPPGRGLFVERGKVQRVQVALASEVDG